MKNKTLFVAVAALPLTTVFEFVDRYLYSDWDFARSIVILIVIDTILSVVKHIIHKDASSEDFWVGTSKKIFVYALLMITANVLTTNTVHESAMGTTTWLGDYLCVAMVVREAISIVENSNAIVPWLPKNILKRLKDFGEEGEYIGKKGGMYGEQ